MPARRQLIRETRVQGEVPDPVPVHIPGKTDRPLSLREEMRRFVQSEVSKVAAQHGVGTFTEEDDFQIDDEDPDLTSPYTVRALQPPSEAPKDDLEGKPTAEDEQAPPPPPADPQSAPPAEEQG